MNNLNFINSSTDQNNSHVVIFQKNVSSPGGQTVAWRVVSLERGGSAKIPVLKGPEFFVSVANPEIEVKDGLMTIKEFSTPVVSMKGGQIARITGDAIAGYKITVE